MHKISEITIRLAQRHARATQKHGDSVIACGKALQKHHNPTAQEYGQIIEECGILIQQYAQDLLLAAQALGIGSLNSTDLYVQCVHAHVYATKAYTEAIRIYLQLIKAQLNVHPRQ